jgi:hypothetical protein
MTQRLTALSMSCGVSAVFAAAALLTPAVVRAQTRAEPNASVAPARAPSFTYTKDIAPILQRSCESCHNPGGIGPMPLTTYEQVRPWARAIRNRTAKREMPPWFVEKNIGIQRFKDDTSLTDAEIEAIERWVDAGAPQGNPADRPARGTQEAAAGSDWTIGTPDLIVASPVLNVKAIAADFMTDVGPTPTGLTEDRYIQAMEVREIARAKGRAPGTPGAPLNYFLVHHATISIADPHAADAAPGDEGMAEHRLMFYQMGQNPTVYPKDVGALLAANSALTFGIHVHSVGEALPLNLEIAFKFYPKGYVPKHLLSPFTAGPSFQHEELDLPAGQANIRVDGYTPVRRPMKLVTFVPHLHANGTRMCVEAIYPDGRPEMLNCARWDHNWSRQYFYEDDAAPLLPAGTMVHVIAWFDNSAANPRNVEPRNWKGYGNRTIDDMSFLLSEAVYLTDEEFKAEVAVRAAHAAARR